MSRVLIFALFALLAWGLDVASKYWIFEALHLEGQKEIIPGFFYLSLSTNPGIAFGMFQSGQNYLLYIIPALLVFIMYYAWSMRGALKLNQAFLGMIFGGALGNYYDRLFHDEVRDFLLVYIGSYPWPIFNVADAAICCAVVGLIALGMWEARKNKAEA